MRKSNLLITFIFLTSCTNLLSQKLSFEWAKHFRVINSSTSAGISSTSSLTDSLGNIYSTITYVGNVDLNPGSSTLTPPWRGQGDFAIIKLNSNGNLIWAKSIGGSDNDLSTSLQIDLQGNILVSGTFSGTVDFNPGTGVDNLTTPDNFVDGFILKLDPNGNFLWVKQISGFGTQEINEFKIDKNGNIFNIGYFEDSVDFDPGIGRANRTSFFIESSFIQKLDSNGNYLWVKVITGNGSSRALSVDLDINDNLLISGYYKGTLDLNPGGPFFAVTSNGINDTYIVKLNNNGNFIWGATLGGNDDDRPFKIRSDQNGNVITTGEFRSTVDFNPGSNTFNLTSASTSPDIFIQKLDSNGNLLWVKHLSNNFGKDAKDLYIDNSSNIYITGFFVNTLNFGQITLNGSTTTTDIYTCKLKPNGAFQWVDHVASSSSYNFATCITADLNGSIFTQGIFSGTVDVNPSTSTLNFSSVGTYDLFIRKLGECEKFESDTIIACNSYTWINGTTYYFSLNNVTHTIPGGSLGGCDSTVTLNLTILNSATSIDTVLACNQYLWIDGNNYTTNNTTATYTYNGASSNGCDSVVQLNLTILASATSTDSVVACDQFTWLDGITYTTSNQSSTISYPGLSSNGCDSIVRLNLTINKVSNPTTITTGISISSTNNNASYQWLNCNQGQSIISGEINQTFTPTVNGSYAVEITENNCVDTSSCVLISTVGVDEIDFNSIESFSIYPNPVNDYFEIDFSSVQRNIVINVYNSLGQQLETKTFKNTSNLIYFFNQAPGSYFIEVIDELDRKGYKKITKN
jgi:hypothetical protein